MGKVHRNLPIVNGSRNSIVRRTNENIFTCVDISIIRTALFMCLSIIMPILTQEGATVQQERRLTWQRLGTNIKIHRRALEHGYFRSRTPRCPTCFPGDDQRNNTETLLRTKGHRGQLKWSDPPDDGTVMKIKWPVSHKLTCRMSAD